MQLLMSSELDGTRPEDKIHQKYMVASNTILETVNPIIVHRNYGSEVIDLFVCPIIVKLPKEMEEAGWYKERMLFKRKTKSTDFRLRVNYDDFNLGNDTKRVQLLIMNIIDSIRILDKRAKKDFNGTALETDILNAFNFKYSELLC